MFGNSELNLLEPLRSEKTASDAELMKLISMAVKRKKAKHAGMTNLKNMKNRPMILIGG